MGNIFSKLSLTNYQYRESINGELVLCKVVFGTSGLGEFDKLLLVNSCQQSLLPLFCLPFTFGFS